MAAVILVTDLTKFLLTRCSRNSISLRIEQLVFIILYCCNGEVGVDCLSDTTHACSCTRSRP